MTKFLTEDVSSLRQETDEGESEGEILAPRPAWMLYQASASEQTPSESYVTTDDDEMPLRQMLNQRHTITPVSSTVNVVSSDQRRAGSVQSDFADYIEHVDSLSTQSTPQSQAGSGWEDPFSKEALSSTMMYLQQVTVCQLHYISQ